MTYRIYAFSHSSDWAVDASTIEEARSLAVTFERRGFRVRVYKQSLNKVGDIVETLVTLRDLSD